MIAAQIATKPKMGPGFCPVQKARMENPRGKSSPSRGHRRSQGCLTQERAAHRAGEHPMVWKPAAGLSLPCLFLAKTSSKRLNHSWGNSSWMMGHSGRKRLLHSHPRGFAKTSLATG